MIEKIKNLRSTEKGKTAFKLSVYMIFFLFVLIIILFAQLAGSKNNNTDPQSSESTIESSSKKQTSYIEKQKKLYNGKYDFSYEIEGTTSVTYSGKYSDGKTTGFRISEDGIIQYEIEDGVSYIKEKSERREYSELYLDLHANLFDFKSIFTKLNALSSQIERKETRTTYNYINIDNYDYTIVTNEEYIESITIKNDQIEYKYTFEF